MCACVRACVRVCVFKAPLYANDVMILLTSLKRYCYFFIKLLRYEEMARAAKYDEEDTSVRSVLLIKDNTRSYTISLWRDLGKMNTPEGSHVEITNVIVQVYIEEKSVFTTWRTKLMVRVTSLNNVQKFINFYSNLYCCFTEDRID